MCTILIIYIARSAPTDVKVLGHSRDRQPVSEKLNYPSETNIVVMRLLAQPEPVYKLQ